MSLRTIQPPPGGRERRRTDLYGRLRRLAYGLLLALAPLAAHAGGAQSPRASDLIGHDGPLHLPTSPHGRQDAPSPLPPGYVFVETSAVQPLQAGLFGELVDWWGYRGTRARPVPLQLSGFEVRLPALPWLSNAAVEAAVEGVGLDLNLPGLGTLFIDLYCGEGGPGDGLRWQAAGAETPDAAQPVTTRRWSLGGAVDIVRRPSGQRAMVINPQLHLDLGRVLDRDDDIEATVVWAHWRPLTERLSADERVLQVEISWRF